MGGQDEVRGCALYWGDGGLEFGFAGGGQVSWFSTAVFFRMAFLVFVFIADGSWL